MKKLLLPSPYSIWLKSSASYLPQLSSRYFPTIISGTHIPLSQYIPKQMRINNIPPLFTNTYNLYTISRTLSSQIPKTGMKETLMNDSSITQPAENFPKSMNNSSLDHIVSDLTLQQKKELLVSISKLVKAEEGKPQPAQNQQNADNSTELKQNSGGTYAHIDTYDNVMESPKSITQENEKSKIKALAPLLASQIILIITQASIPFIGFGFMDNCLMIVFGDMIDRYAGAMLTLSTMAAAGLGNTISCATGVITGGFVERLVNKLGLPEAHLTIEQHESLIVKNLRLIGSFLGVIIGCLLGMSPLVFLAPHSVNSQAPSE